MDNWEQIQEILKKNNCKTIMELMKKENVSLNVSTENGLALEFKQE